MGRHDEERPGRRSRHRRTVAGYVAALVLVVGTGVGVLSPGAAEPAGARQEPAQTVLNLVNTERKKSACPALQDNARLRTAAHKHAKDMATRNYFSHESPEGATPADRAAAEGYPGGVGENIASGQRAAAEVVRSWMRSAGHRANILDCRYRHSGVGVVRAGNGTTYWVQVFGIPR